MPLHRAQLYADSIVTLVYFRPRIPHPKSIRRIVSQLKALHFPKLVALQGLKVKSSNQISLLKHLTRTAPNLSTIQVKTWPKNGSMLAVLSRFAALVKLNMDLMYSSPSAVDRLEDWEANTQAAVWKDLKTVSLA
ncbi:hypothetical protein CSUB01_12183 [Colletotrichum sublineola]|uniref:Uncharacterized protein n=1 Tax=Colletotrichum sublineola TaxID=1173701 RepID=A0A066XQI5_COLSU|nr:hypothetical protein CSUB01_12183 [Colletotrichum sublineola]